MLGHDEDPQALESLRMDTLRRRWSYAKKNSTEEDANAVYRRMEVNATRLSYVAVTAVQCMVLKRGDFDEVVANYHPSVGEYFESVRKQLKYTGVLRAMLDDDESESSDTGGQGMCACVWGWGIRGASASASASVCMYLCLCLCLCLCL